MWTFLLQWQNLRRVRKPTLNRDWWKQNTIFLSNVGTECMRCQKSSTGAQHSRSFPEPLFWAFFCCSSGTLHRAFLTTWRKSRTIPAPWRASVRHCWRSLRTTCGTTGNFAWFLYLNTTIWSWMQRKTFSTVPEARKPALISLFGTAYLSKACNKEVLVERFAFAVV